MPAVSNTILVAKPLQACWESLADLNRLSEWDESIQSAITFGSQGKGQRIDLEQRRGNDQIRYIAAYMTRYHAPQMFAFQYNWLGVTWEVRYVFAAHRQHTRIERTREAKGLLGLLIWYWQAERVNHEEHQTAIRTKQKFDGEPLA